MNVKGKLTQVFHEVFEDNSIVLHDTMTADDIEGWDSFAHMSLISLVEVTFAITISDSEVLGLKNVGDMLRLVKDKTGRE